MANRSKITYGIILIGILGVSIYAYGKLHLNKTDKELKKFVADCLAKTSNSGNGVQKVYIVKVEGTTRCMLNGYPQGDFN